MKKALISLCILVAAVLLLFGLPQLRQQPPPPNRAGLSLPVMSTIRWRHWKSALGIIWGKSPMKR